MSDKENEIDPKRGNDYLTHTPVSDTDKEKIISSENKRKSAKTKSRTLFKDSSEALDFVETLVQKTSIFTNFLSSRIEQTAQEEEEQEEDQPKLLSGGTLMPHQIGGYHWLKCLYQNCVNAILADEMGLGKTVQAIAMIAHLVEEDVNGPFLVCAPLSTLNNWVQEFKKFTPKVPVLLYYGSKQERLEMWNKVKAVKPSDMLPVFVTSYEVALRDSRYLKQADWKYIVVDEAQRLKNSHCLLFQAFKSFKVYTNVPHLLLTGTPLQNSLSELWSILNFTLPQVFVEYDKFQSLLNFTELDAANKDVLFEHKKDRVVLAVQQLLTPFFLRRTKDEVLTGMIPRKREIVLYVPMTTMQEHLVWVVRKIISEMAENTEKPTIIAEIHARKKRKIDYSEDCDDEFVCSDSENEVYCVLEHNDTASDTASSSSDDKKLKNSPNYLYWELRRVCQHPFLLQKAINPRKDKTVLKDLLQYSGKMLILDSLLMKLKANGHKVLVFSQLLGVLDILEEYCELRCFKYYRLDGSVKIEDRQIQIDSFNKDKTFLFLISTRAGGLGLNLAAADTVIIFDSDYNPQCDLQAQDRCHRIGQKNPVLIYRLVTNNSIDKDIVQTASSKRVLEKLIIQDGRYNSSDTLRKRQKPLTKQEFLHCLNATFGKMEYEISDFGLSDIEFGRLLDRSDL